MDCLDDNFLSQHVTIPTRKDSILDLIISDQPDTADDVRNLMYFTLISSAFPAELQRQSVSLLQTAVMNRHIYIYLHIYFSTPASRVYRHFDIQNIYIKHTPQKIWG